MGVTLIPERGLNETLALYHELSGSIAKGSLKASAAYTAHKTFGAATGLIRLGVKGQTFLAKVSTNLRSRLFSTHGLPLAKELGSIIAEEFGVPMATHPQVSQILSLIANERYLDVYYKIKDIVERDEHKSFDIDVYRRILSFLKEVGISSMFFGETDIPSKQPSKSGRTSKDIFSIRNIAEYDRFLFGSDPLDTYTGITIPNSETRLGRLIKSLHHDPVIADFGGGVGIFGMEVKQLRRDAQVFVVENKDLETLHHGSSPQIHRRYGKVISLDEIQRHVHFIEGEPHETKIPAKGVDLIISTTVAPHIDNPLAYIAHLYNQLNPQGILVMQTNPNVYDLLKPWNEDPGLQDRLIDYLVDQRAAVVDTRFDGHPVLVLRRQDNRKLKINAKLREVYHDALAMESLNTVKNPAIRGLLALLTDDTKAPSTTSFYEGSAYNSEKIADLIDPPLNPHYRSDDLDIRGHVEKASFTHRIINIKEIQTLTALAKTLEDEGYTEEAQLVRKALDESNGEIIDFLLGHDAYYSQLESDQIFNLLDLETHYAESEVDPFLRALCLTGSLEPLRNHLKNHLSNPHNLAMRRNYRTQSLRVRFH